jgi:hypothetical protein
MTEVQVPSHSDPDITYAVVVQEPGSVDDAVCECEGFQFRGSCSHQQEAVDSICGWVEGNFETQTKEEHRNRLCPVCGGPTESIMVLTLA